MSPPGFHDLYMLRAGRASDGAFRVEASELGVDWFAVSRGTASPPARAEFRWFMGRRAPAKVIWTGNAYPLIVHAALAEELSAGAPAGWSTYPVEIRGRDGEIHGDFLGIVIHGRCGERDLTLSRIELRELPGGFFPEFVGFYFDPSTWDGSDLAVSGGTLHRIVTHRAAEVFQRHAGGHVEVTPLPQDRIGTSNYEIGRGAELLPADFLQRVREVYELEGQEPPARYQPGAI